MDCVFLNPDLDAEVTIMVEPTDTVQQTVTEILGDVDGRLSEHRANEKLNEEELEAIRFLEPKNPATIDIAEIFTEPTAKSAPRPKSKPMPKRPPTRPRGRGSSRSLRPLQAEASDALTTPRTSTATFQTLVCSYRTRPWKHWGA